MDLQTNTPTFKFLPRTLEGDLKDRTRLRKEYEYVFFYDSYNPGVKSPHRRLSYIRIIHLFGPTISTLVGVHHLNRDLRLAEEAKKAIDRYAASGAPESSVAYVGLKIWLEVETILCTEYRYVDHHQIVEPGIYPIFSGIRTFPS